MGTWLNVSSTRLTRDACGVETPYCFKMLITTRCDYFRVIWVGINGGDGIWEKE